MDLTKAGLEPGPEEMRELVERALERIVTALSTLDEQPASDLKDGIEVAKLVMEPMPERGQAYNDLLHLIFEILLPKGHNTTSPGALSYVTGGGIFHSAVADLIASAINRYVAYWGSSPGLAQLEQTVIRWFADIVGLPSSAGGVLLSGGSIANLSALITARRAKLGDDFALGRMYASDQVHHSVRKAAVLAGFSESALQVVPSDDDFRIRIDAVRDAIRRDRAAGKAPFLLVASAGTTSSGAIDDLRAMAELARVESLWLHVDAAYGGFFAMTARGRAALAGIEQADSIVLDPHKSLFLPFGTGCLLARNVETLRRAHLLHSEYIQEAVELGEATGSINFADLSPEMSRGSRGLRVWLPMKLLGADTFRRALDEKLDLARFLCADLERTPGFEIVAAPQLAIVAFRVTRPGRTEAELDALNRAVLDRVNRKGRVHLSPTVLGGRFTLRVSVLSFRTHKTTVSACIEDLTQALRDETGAT